MARTPKPAENMAVVDTSRTPGGMKPWLTERLVCPRDRQNLALRGEVFTCPSNHTSPLVGNFPVMLLDEVEPTHGACSQTLSQTRNLVVTADLAWQERPGCGGIVPFGQPRAAGTKGLPYEPP